MMQNASNGCGWLQKATIQAMQAASTEFLLIVSLRTIQDAWRFSFIWWKLSQADRRCFNHACLADSLGSSHSLESTSNLESW